MDTNNKIREFFKENFMVDLDGDHDPADSFLENGIIDSTGVLELVTFLEETFNIKVEDEEIIPDNLDSINNIEKYIVSKQ